MTCDYGIMSQMVWKKWKLWVEGVFPWGHFTSYLKNGFAMLPSPSPPFLIMSFSDQHPYSKYVASGFHSPDLQKAYIEVGDNTNTYLVSADIVAFRLKLIVPTHLWKLGQLQRWSSLKTKCRRFGKIRPLFPLRWMAWNPG